MGSHEGYVSPAIDGEESAPIEEKVLNDYFDHIRKAYQQAGLDSESSGRTCPGFTDRGVEFQVSLEQDPNGENGISHFLLVDTFSNPEGETVTEADITAWGGECDMATVRRRTPENSYYSDFDLKAWQIKLYTRYIGFHLKREHFKPVEYKTRLPLSQ